MQRKIEILSFDGCPNAATALRRAHEAVTTTGIDAAIVAVDVASAEQAAQLQFLGSPSVRIDGLDVDAAAADDSDYSLRCRLYAHDGRMEGAPPVEWIASALRGQLVARGAITNAACCGGAPKEATTEAATGSPSSCLDLAALAAGLSAAFPPGSEKLLVALIRLLGGRKPVSRNRLALALDWSVDRVEEALASVPSIEYEDANIVGAVVSLRPTAHAFEVEGRRLYTWCALDALFVPALLQRTCRVTSPCPATGESVCLDIGPDAVLETVPPGAVVSIVTRGCDGDLRRSFCDRVRFFRSTAAAEAYVGDDAVVLSVADAFLLGSAITSHLGWQSQLALNTAE